MTSKELWLAIPTRLEERRGYLTEILRNSGIPLSQTILIRTTPGDPYEGVHNIFDTENLNISRWWNLGIDFANSRGAKYLAILNDDVRFHPGALQTIYADTKLRGASLGHGKPEFKNAFGHCFVLDLSTGLKLDEKFRWYFGDSDLYIRAKRTAGGISISNVEVANIHAAEETQMNPMLMDISKSDYRKFLRRHPLEVVHLIHRMLAIGKLRLKSYMNGASGRD